MVGKKNIRDYEVSIWTLQDSFITVLKQSNLENREKIQEPKMTLKDDGEYTFSFKIPMYLQEDSDLTEKPYFKRERIWKENPIWYTVHNGNLMVNLRKVKVIFNKKSPDEEVFEFIINKITERHEGYSKICEVDCDGLAFHELGKQGYEIELSGDNYRAEIENLIDETGEENENEDNESLEDFDAPVNNINYWVEKVLENSNWDYIINMDWSIYDGIIVDNKTYLNMTDEEREEFNNTRASAEPPLRRKDTIYKDPYVSSWNINNGNIVAETVVDDINQLEKLKTVEGKESNRYNLLQTIAETFQVFCKFKYEYDDNYHIIGRKVIFYNNFINESEGVIDFNYSYNTDEITREMESSDLVTKMYVKSLKDAGTFSGEVTLADTDANPTLENFLLNFDYLYKIGTISQEQYDLIKDLQVTLRTINLQYAEQNKLLEKYERQKIDEEVKLASAKDMIEQATQRVAEANTELDAIKDGNLYPNFNNKNPLRCYLIHYSDDSTKAYINLQKAFSGLHPNSLKLYKEVNKDNSVKGNYIDLNNISFEKNEETQLITKIIVENIIASTDVLYATFDFDARTPSETIKQMWISRAKQAEIDKEEAQTALGINDEEVISPNGLISKIEEISGENGTLKDLLSQRAEIIAKFERLMGPALREGTWQPEDEYADYQVTNIYNLGSIPLTNGNIERTDGKASFIWDNELFNGEQKLYYLFGIDGIKKYYPCIKLTSEQWDNLQDIDNLNLIYRDIYLGQYANSGPHSMSDTKVNHYLAVGASNGCQFAFLRGLSGDNKGKIIPVIMVLGIESVLEAKVGNTTYTSYQQIQQSARLRPIEITDNGLIEDNSQGIGIGNITWIMPTESTYEIVYPRFKINSHNYLLTFPEDKVFLNDEPLEIMSDYTDELYRDGDEYITIKNVLLGDENKYSFHYARSTAAEAMYLDAIKILKENSVPKTSYTIKPIAIDNSIVGTAYNSIGQLAHINDHELKFKNVQGYISEVELDLDKPWEDSYTIKNYKTKFEDLFSTIVAQTESMKKNSQIFSMVSNAFDANGYLTAKMVDNIQNRLSIPTSNVYVPSPAEIYAQYEPTIKQQLKDAFNEAGEVLAAAQNSVTDVNNLNITNAAILGSFVENIKENMTPTTFNGASRNKQAFKIGDIWNKEGNVYVATENSSQLYPNSYPSDILTSLKGWSLVKDGSLAQIKGASLNINSDSGKIELLAENEINIGTNGLLKLAGNNVKIIGNETVEMGGPDVKIYSADTTGVIDSSKGIHIYATRLGNNSATSAVDISGNGIILRAANGIKISSGSGIDIYSSDTANTSAIKINRNDGIFIGSTLPVIFYSGGTDKTMTGAASVLISQDRILFGVTSGKNSSGVAVDLTANSLTFGTGIVNSNNTTTVTNIGTKGNSGVQITREYIRLATGDSTINSYIGMDKNGIIISNQNSSYNGGLVKISQSGIIIGTATSNNVNGIDTTTDKTNIQSGTLGTVTSSKGTFQVYAPNFVVDETGTLYAYNAYIRGTIYSGAGQIGGWDITSNQIRRYIPADQSPDGKEFNIYMSSNYYTGTNQIPYNPVFAVKYDNDWKFYVRSNGVLFAKEANITGTITASSLTLIGEAKIPYDKINNRPDLTIYISKDGTIGSTPANGSTGFVVSSAGLLTASNAVIWGKITSSEGAIGGWTIETNRLKSGSGNNYVEINAGASSATNGSAYAIWAGSTTATSAPFRVTKGGALTSTSLTVGSGNNLLTYTSSDGLTVKGSITATSGSIGGWTIGSNFMANSDSIASSTMGLYPYSQTDSSYPIIWAGGKRLLANTTNGNTSSELAPFRVTKAGKLYATGADISGIIKATSGYIGGSTGWKISSNYLYSASLSGDNWSNFSGDGIVLFSNNTYSEIHMYKDGNNLLNINTDASGEEFALAFGDYDGHTNYFAYTANGQLIIDGKLNATSGTFQNVKITGTTVIDTQGSVKISGSSLKFVQDDNNGLSVVQNSTKGCIITLKTKSSNSSLGQIALEEGLIKLTSKNDNDNEKGSIVFNAPEVVFRFNATNSSTYRLAYTTSVDNPPSYTNEADCIIWIYPNGNKTTIDGLTWHNCSVKFHRFKGN